MAEKETSPDLRIIYGRELLRDYDKYKPGVEALRNKGLTVDEYDGIEMDSGTLPSPVAHTKGGRQLWGEEAVLKYINSLQSS